MAEVLDRYIGDNGEVLIPVDSNTYPDLVSDKGVYYLAIHHTQVAAGLINGGLLLAISYPTG